MIRIYTEFENGEREIFRGITEEHAICNAVAYAVENDTDITFYTEMEDYGNDY